MATKVVMEALSPTMEEGRLVKWNKNEGDQIKTGDVLAEVETDKAVMELVARGDGVLRKRLANEGDASPVGTLLAVIAAPDENIDSIVGSAGAAVSAGAQSAQSAGAPTQAGGAPNQAVAETREAPAKNPVPQAPKQSQGEASTPPQQKAGGPAAAPPQRPAAPRPPAAPSAPRGNGASHPAATDGRRRSSPLARRLANDRGIQLGSIQGTGPGGRIVKRDIENAKAAGTAAGRSAAAERLATEGDFKDVPLTQIRKTIAKRLSESNGPIPTFFLTAEFDVTRAAEMRTQLAEMGDQYKASFNDIIIKAVALALAEHPEVNAHWLGDKIRKFNRIHVAMAVAVEDGLITPVLFDTDRMTLWEISAKARELAGKARERRLTPEEYTGSTFSVSNLGMFGIDQFTAIINPPETGILAIGGVEEKPVVVDGQLEVRQRMRVTMSCDHRAIDGATGAKFLQTVRRYIENPLALLI
ncbi:MAG TPA: dihydrolipoamide acetyltransferase family protein [Gemmatimonadaceae bacterium]|jgi:pyruvate dehydrogenase E2 component (dihydrolipoamide acetyltransferase)|nr:dihydrolipoamide acetyltransferase family protein [Gemmatimonadaceae bacterium]